MGPKILPSAPEVAFMNAERRPASDMTEEVNHAESGRAKHRAGRLIGGLLLPRFYKSLELSPKLRGVTAVAMGSLVLASTAGRAEASPPMKYVGVVENSVIDDLNPAMAETVTEEAKAAGFNTIEIRLPYSLGSREINNDRERLCRAANAVYGNGMNLYITSQGFNSVGHPGYAPHGGKEIDNYAAALNDTVETLMGPNRCVKTPVEDITMNIFNEPNDTTFWNAQYDSSGRWVAAMDYTKVLAKAYGDLKWEQKHISEEDGYDVKITVAAGGLSSHHDPLKFIELMGQAKRSLNIRRPLFDLFSYHPYGLTSADSPATVHPGGFIGMADIGKLNKALTNAFGYLPKVIYNEYGAETSVPSDKAGLYYRVQPPNADPVADATQSLFYNQAFSLAACQPNVVGINLFKLRDEPDLWGWQSGIEDPLGGHKPAYQSVSQTLNEAKDGTIADCSTAKAIRIKAGHRKK
jgi:hypothetical protein